MKKDKMTERLLSVATYYYMDQTEAFRHIIAYKDLLIVGKITNSERRNFARERFLRFAI